MLINRDQKQVTNEWENGMALKLSLKPGEKIVINGVVIQNGDRRSNMIIQNRASILREKDIMQEHEADTPAKRIYLTIMLMYMDEEGYKAYYEHFVQLMSEFMECIESADALEICAGIGREIMSGNYYRGIVGCRKLIGWEEARLLNVA